MKKIYTGVCVLGSRNTTFCVVYNETYYNILLSLGPWPLIISKQSSQHHKYIICTQ